MGNRKKQMINRNGKTISDCTSDLIKTIRKNRQDMPKEIMDALNELERALEWYSFSGGWYQKDLGSQLIAANRDAAQKMKDETEQAYEIATRLMKEDEEDDA